MNKNELYHHGIIGQKWGKRNGPPYPLNPSDRSSAEKKTNRQNKSSDKEDVNNKIRSMSDDEIRQHIARLELERKYKELLKGDGKKQINKGKSFVVGILEKSTRNIGEQLGTYVLGTLVNKAAKKVPGIEENVVNPKKGQKDK